jgi:hypothetical protein
MDARPAKQRAWPGHFGGRTQPLHPTPPRNVRPRVRPRAPTRPYSRPLTPDDARRRSVTPAAVAPRHGSHQQPDVECAAGADDSRRAPRLAGRKGSPLLRGEELRRAEEWLTQAAAGVTPSRLSFKRRSSPRAGGPLRTGGGPESAGVGYVNPPD